MPEGDTIARHAARLRPLLVGAPLVEVRHRGAVLHDLEGDVVESIDTHGKHLWLRLRGGQALHVHLGMEGGWTLLSPEGLRASPRARLESASLVLLVARGGALCHRAPTVELLRGPDAAAARRTLRPRAPQGSASLGPDVLAEPLDVEGMLARAYAAGQADRPLGEVLLDQRVVAGIGNLWKSELCFLERLDPRAPVRDVAPERLRRLLERAARMMRESVGAYRRVTTVVDPRRDLPPAGLGRYWVYRRGGRPCPRCRTPIERIVQGADAGRSTYFCPRCVEASRV
jgi:endonuclease-8